MLKEYIQKKAVIVDEMLEKFVAADMYPPIIFEAMRYSLFAGGKRLRPVLLMAAGDAINRLGEKYANAACALEMIHTYSLIHDDLPSMDNDDFRRGKLTNHKVFGEGMAILAGDALLTGAFEILGKQAEVAPAILLEVICEIAAAAGAGGMIGGQAIDLISAGKKIEPADLKYMHEAKTGALFKAALRAGAKLAGGSDLQLAALTGYAENFGLAFQITDDILDVTGNAEKIGKPVGSDIKNQKSTYVSLYTIEEARKFAYDTVTKAICSLEIFGCEADVLRELANYLLQREN